jgi:hypothetical protein
MFHYLITINQSHFTQRHSFTKSEVSTFPHCSEQCPHNTKAYQGATLPAYARNAPNKMWIKKTWYE